MTVNRFCSSGLQTIAMAAQRILVDASRSMVAGGVESISCVQNEMNKTTWRGGVAAEAQARDLLADAADRRERREALRHRARAARTSTALDSQQRAAAARSEGRFKDEIVPITTTKMKIVDKATGQSRHEEVTASEDEGIRADTTYEGVSQDQAGVEGGCIAAGNASQFSDGAAACVMMDKDGRAQRACAARHLPRLRGRRLRAGRDGHRPGVRGAEAAQRTGLKVEDIGLWELNEAFAVQVLYCRDARHPDER
jgi:acetyl-CoA C-acetyltransferase